MLKKINTIRRIHELGIVVVVRAKSSDMAASTAKACMEGGIPAIEVTFTVPGAHRVISELRKTYDESKLLIGAGTVLDSATARIAILEGAEYIVSPHFDPETARLCHRYQVPYMPGCMTITEMVTALEAGADIIKLFPGSAFGPSFVKAVKGPLPQVELMPTGGVSLANVGEWIQNGCVAVGVGSELTAGAKSGDFGQVTQTAKDFVAAIQKSRADGAL